MKKTCFRLSFVPVLFFFLASLCAASFAWAESVPPSYIAPGREMKRLAALPFFEGKPPKNGLVRFDDETAPKEIRHYAFLEDKFESFGTTEIRTRRIDTVDLNGDQYKDIVLVRDQYTFPSTEQVLIFYAGCGNGWYYEVLGVVSDSSSPGGGYTLLDSVEYKGMPWKRIDAPGYANIENEKHAFYCFLGGSYKRAEAQDLKKLPWVQNGAHVVFFNDDKPSVPAPRYRVTIPALSDQPAELSRLYFNLGYNVQEMIMEVEEVDLNGDAHKDLVLKHLKDGYPMLHSFLAGCGNGWYMLVFQTTAPKYKLAYPAVESVEKSGESRGKSSNASISPKTVKSDAAGETSPKVVTTATGSPLVSLAVGHTNSANTASKGWKNIMLPPAGSPSKNKYAIHRFDSYSMAVPLIYDVVESAYEVYTFSRNGYAPATADSEFLEGLSKLPWVSGKRYLTRVTPYGREIYGIHPRPKAARNTIEALPVSSSTARQTATDKPAGQNKSTGQSFTLTWLNFVPWADGQYPMSTIRLNDDSLVDHYYRDDRYDTDGDGKQAYTFYAGCGRDYFINVIDSAFSKKGFKADRIAGRKSGEMFWYDVSDGERTYTFEAESEMYIRSDD